MLKKISKNNKGFSLLEMIIVMSVAAIMMGLITITYVAVYNANITNATDALKSAINTARVQSMAKGVDVGKLTLTKRDGFIYAQIGDEGETTICTSAIEAYYFTCTTTEPSPADYAALSGHLWPEGGTVEFTFDTAGTVRTVTPDTINCFAFKRGNRTMYVIIYPETGKVDSAIMQQ